MPSPRHKLPGSDSGTSSQRRATRRTISSNQSSAGDAVVVKVVEYDLTAAAGRLRSSRATSTTNEADDARPGASLVHWSCASLNNTMKEVSFVTRETCAAVVALERQASSIEQQMDGK